MWLRESLALLSFKAFIAFSLFRQAVNEEIERASARKTVNAMVNEEQQTRINKRVMDTTLESLMQTIHRRQSRLQVWLFIFKGIFIFMHVIYTVIIDILLLNFIRFFKEQSP